MQIITRAQARAASSKRYFTGSACKYGHLAERLVSNGSCMECAYIRQTEKYHANIEQERLRQKLRREADPNSAAKKKARRIAKDPQFAARLSIREADRASRSEARSAGQTTYLSARPCSAGHDNIRSVHDTKCVECNRLRCAAAFEARARLNPRLIEFRQTRAQRKENAIARAVLAQPWRDARASRQSAIALGERTYTGKPCPMGHTGTRYTGSGCCVECASIRAKSQEKKLYDAKYCATNAVRIQLRQKNYYKRTAEQQMAYVRMWVAKHPDKRRSISKSYKARRRAQEVGGDSTAVVHKWESSATKQCYWCGKKCAQKYHVDHYVPLSKGGKHEVSNLVISCPRCNLKKNAKDPYEFANTVGRLF